MTDLKLIIIIGISIFVAVYIFPLLLGAIVGIVEVIAEAWANRKTYCDDDKMNSTHATDEDDEE